MRPHHAAGKGKGHPRLAREGGDAEGARSLFCGVEAGVLLPAFTQTSGFETIAGVYFLRTKRPPVFSQNKFCAMGNCQIPQMATWSGTRSKSPSPSLSWMRIS